MANVGIKNSWSLMAFARMKGQMKVASFTNNETGENFKSCVFVDKDRNTTLVGFSGNLGELTPKEIVDRKNELQVVELESNKFKLCKVGENNWADVDLGL